MNRFVQNIARINKVSVISIYKTNQHNSLFLVTLKKSKSQIEIIQKIEFETINELASKIDKSLPTIVHVFGAGVLFKKIDLESQSDRDWVRNLDLKAISATVYKAGNLEYYGLLRNSNYDDLLHELLSHKLKIADLYFGPTVVCVLKDYFKTKFQIYEYCFDFTNSGDELMERRIEAQELESSYLDDFQLEPNFVPGYAAGFHWFIQTEDIETLQANKIEKEEIFYESAFNRVGKYTLVFFFISLLISYFLVLWLGYKNSELTYEKIYSSKSIEMSKKLSEELKEKIEILNATGMVSENYFVYYIDEIVSTVPKQIKLTDLQINPLKEEIKERKKVAFISKNIFVKGVSSSDSAFNSWITMLKTKPWIKILKVKSVDKDKYGMVLFELNIEF